MALKVKPQSTEFCKIANARLGERGRVYVGQGQLRPLDFMSTCLRGVNWRYRPYQNQMSIISKI